MEPKAIIFTAPSGAGKTTLVRDLLEQIPDLQFSISACTRERRSNEVDGRDYYFMSPEAFRNKVQEGAFAEWEEVYPGNFYGTLKQEVERIWALGKSVIFDVDVQGALTLKKYFGSRALSVFIDPPSADTLKERLESRATESPEKIAMRLKKAGEELQYANAFDARILNSNLEIAKESSRRLVRAFLLKP